MHPLARPAALSASTILCLAAATPSWAAGEGAAKAADHAAVAAHWTGERRAKAMPRDLVVDPRGLAYLKGRDGALEPYGHAVAPLPVRAAPAGKPAGGVTDTTGPAVSAMVPAAGSRIGAAQTFSAAITDAGGVRAVTFKVRKGTAIAQSFTAAQTGTDTWSAALQGFTDGDWSWQVVARDKAGNTTTTGSVAFKVSTAAAGGSDTVTNAAWSLGGLVQRAAGRIYFEMPYQGGWGGFVCSGTVAADATTGRSVIITAAHCVYDDANKVFARNVLFIPDQDGTTGAGTDTNCSNDPLGCWMPAFGVVDVNYTTRKFPDNDAWDYAYYVVGDTGAHAGSAASSEALDLAVTPLPVNFGSVYHDDGSAGANSQDFTYALGYSYSSDPNFMYCAEDMTSTNGTANWWLSSCGLSGGASGGPWIQPMSTVTGGGDIVSVNSWGYTNAAGMAGPKLVGTSAGCVFDAARTLAFPAARPADGQAGSAVTCP